MTRIDTPIDKRMFKHDDYRRLSQIRALDNGAGSGFEGKRIIEGRAVIFDKETVLFTYEGIDYKEIIDRDAFVETDTSKAFFKYNHSDNVMVMARTKNKTLTLEIREDGLWFRAELADTTAGRDLYELAKRGDIDEVSFAFTIREESYDNEAHTWRVRKVGTLYDIAAVEQPAYDQTQLYARRYGDAEAHRRQEVETLELARKRAKVRLNINK